MGKTKRTPVLSGILVLLALALTSSAIESPKEVYVLSFPDLPGFGNSSGYGNSVACAGDVNADGYDDVIIGAMYARANNLTSGAAYVYSGKDGSALYTLRGATQDDNFGSGVDGAGDVNGDGYDDFIIGIRVEDTQANNAGSAVLFSGKTGKALLTFYGTKAGERLGESVGGAGDVNRDGIPDLVAGAPLYQDSTTGYQGRAFVYSGKNGAVLYTFKAESKGELFGQSVGGAGDVNGDGYADVIVGGPTYKDGLGNTPGKAYVFSGKDGSALLKLFGGASFDYFGRSVAAAGDVNADGCGDVIVGACRMGSGPGFAEVYSGKNGARLHRFVSEYKGGVDWYGFSVSGAGDLNRDGYDDVFVGAPKDDYYGQDGGTVRAFSGMDGKLLFSIDGAEGDVYGKGVACAGDVNADGYVDLLVGATGIQKAYVYAGVGPKVSVVVDGNADATRFADVTLTLDWKDTEAKISGVRLRNDGGAWSDWRDVAVSMAWTLGPDEGLRTVSAQFRDVNELESAIVTDSIILDRTPPTGAIAIDHGAFYTSFASVTVAMEYSDAGSGVTDVRLRNESGAWSAWMPIAPSKAWTLSSGNGVRLVSAQYRDAAGNVSESLLDSILVIPDPFPPTISGFRIAGLRPLYLLPDQPLDFVVFAADNDSGSGLDSFRASTDGGSHWSNWYPTIGTGGYLGATLHRPESAGLARISIEVRDRAGNVSGPQKDELYILERELPWLGGGAKFSGMVADAQDVDAAELELVEGDRLRVTAKAMSSIRKQTLHLALDLCRRDGEHVFDGRYPADLETAAVRDFVVPATGRYVLVVRRDPKSPAEIGSYLLRVKVKQAKSNRKVKADFSGQEITFEAAAGATLKMNLKGAGLEPDRVSLTGPDGPVALTPKGRPGRVALKTVLTAGSGTYRIRLGADITVSAKWTLKPAKVKGTVRE